MSRDPDLEGCADTSASDALTEAGPLKNPGAATRVVHLLDEGITDDAKAVSARRWAAVLAELGRHDVSVRLVTMGRSDRHAALIRAAPVDNLGRQGDWRVIGSIFRLRALISRWQPDVIHAHETLPAITAGLAAVGHPSQVVYHRYHTYSSRRHARASRFASALADRIIAISRAVVVAAVTDDQAEAARVELVHDGTQDLERAVLPEKVDHIRSEFPTPLLVAVARLRFEKGIDILLDAINYLPRERSWTLCVVGAGSEERTLKDRVRPALRHRVRFIGHRDDVANWYAAADVVVIPSRTEGLGHVALEAMSCSCPVIASAVGGLLDVVVDGTTGVLVAPEAPEEIAQAMRDLMGDAARRQEMGSASRARYEELFSIGSMVDGWLGVYRDLLRRPGRDCV